jgi:hypothetical protein
MESVAEGWQRNWGLLSGMVRVVSNLREGSKILTFLYRPRVVCSSLLHLRCSWMACSCEPKKASLSLDTGVAFNHH